MFYKEQSDKKTMCVNNLKLGKVDTKKESKTTPHVSAKLSVSAYDRIVQLVTNHKPDVKPPQEEQNKRGVRAGLGATETRIEGFVHMSL